MGDHTLTERVSNELIKSIEHQFGDPTTITNFDPNQRVFSDLNKLWRRYPKLGDAYLVEYIPIDNSEKHINYIANKGFSVLKLAGHTKYFGYRERKQEEYEGKIILGAPQIEVVQCKPTLRDAAIGPSELTYQFITLVNPYTDNPAHYSTEYPGMHKGLGQYLLDPNLLEDSQALKTKPPQQVYDHAGASL